MRLRFGGRAAAVALALSLAALAWLPALPAGAQPAFSDVPGGYWGYGYIEVLAQQGIVHGYPDGTFRPNDPVSWAQFAALLVGAAKLTPALLPTQPAPSIDPGQWYAPDLDALYQEGALNGPVLAQMSDPNRPISREAVAYLVAYVRNGGPPPAGAAPDFTDASSIAPWASSAVAADVAAGVLHGYPDGSFQPLAGLTRAEAAVVIVHLLGLTPLAPPPNPQAQSLLSAMPGLNAAEEQAFAQAAQGLPAQTLAGEAARLGQLGASQQQEVGQALTTVMQGMSADQQAAFAATLLGTADAAQQQEVAAMVPPALSQFGQDLYGVIPGAAQLVAPDQDQMSQFLQQVFATLVPHVLALLGNSLQNLPPDEQLLAIGADEAAAQQLPPKTVVLDLMLLQDSQTAQFMMTSCQEAGASSVYNGMSPFISGVLVLCGAHYLPDILQQAYSDCVLAPACTSADRQGLIEYVQMEVQDGKAQAGAVSALVNQMQSGSEAATQAWMSALGGG